MNKIMLIVQFCCVMIMLITIISTNHLTKNNERMDNLSKRDPKKTCLHINQFKNHQDIYIIPIEKWNEHPVEWWKNNYPKEFYVGYYTFSLFYWGQRSPK